MPRLPLIALACLVATGARAASPTPAGLWQTVDDETGRVSGQVRIADTGGVFTGNVAQIADAADRGKNCVLCDDDRKDQPVLGMQVIRGVRQDGEVWDGGTILDPRKGKVYKVRMKLADNGTHLVVRGFVGISLLGRSQTWTRLE